MEDPRIYDADHAPGHCPKCHVLIVIEGIGSMVNVSQHVSALSRYRCKVCREVWYVRDAVLLGAPAVAADNQAEREPPK